MNVMQKCGIFVQKTLDSKVANINGNTK